MLSGAAYVSPELKARVAAAIERLGYERNSLASGLKRGRTALIGLIVPDVTNPFFTGLVQATQHLAHQAGYSVLLGTSDWDVGRESGLLRLMRSHRAEGTILCPTGSVDDYAALSTGPMRLVMVDNASPELRFDTVALDNRKAARLAVGHILSLGHRRVASMAGRAHQFVGDERLAGFLEAMAERGLTAGPELIRRGDFLEDEAYRACGELLALAPRPTALFVANNLMLIGVMRALAAAGIAVPAHMSVASIDDFPWASAFVPALTVVRQPIEAMAAEAFALLMRRVAGEEGEPRHRVFEPELVIRSSCAEPGSRGEPVRQVSEADAA
jgi:LacI family transcriptional regulator, galactose operon repressor